MPISRFVDYAEAPPGGCAVCAPDSRVKEMIFVAVGATKGCDDCVNSHTAAARQR